MSFRGRRSWSPGSRNTKSCGYSAAGRVHGSRARELAPAAGMTVTRSVQTEVGDVLRVRLQFALCDAENDVGQDRIGRRRNPDLLALSDDIAVEERDLGATALHHVLAGRRTVLATTAIRHGQAMLVDFLLRHRVALAGARQHLRVQMADLVKGIAERLADPDRLAAEPVREMPQRIVLD